MPTTMVPMTAMFNKTATGLQRSRINALAEARAEQALAAVEESERAEREGRETPTMLAKQATDKMLAAEAKAAERKALAEAKAAEEAKAAAEEEARRQAEAEDRLRPKPTDTPRKKAARAAIVASAEVVARAIKDQANANANAVERAKDDKASKAALEGAKASVTSAEAAAVSAATSSRQRAVQAALLKTASEEAEYVLAPMAEAAEVLRGECEAAKAQAVKEREEEQTAYRLNDDFRAIKMGEEADAADARADAALKAMLLAEEDMKSAVQEASATRDAAAAEKQAAVDAEAAANAKRAEVEAAKRASEAANSASAASEAAVVQAVKSVEAADRTVAEAQQAHARAIDMEQSLADAKHAASLRTDVASAEARRRLAAYRQAEERQAAELEAYVERRGALGSAFNEKRRKALRDFLDSTPAGSSRSHPTSPPSPTGGGLRGGSSRGGSVGGTTTTSKAARAAAPPFQVLRSPPSGAYLARSISGQIRGTEMTIANGFAKPLSPKAAGRTGVRKLGGLASKGSNSSDGKSSNGRERRVTSSAPPKKAISWASPRSPSPSHATLPFELSGGPPTECRFGAKCTHPGCPYDHPRPLAPPTLGLTLR